MTEIDMALSASWPEEPAGSQPPTGRSQRQRAFAAAHRHSRGVALLRIVLPLAGLLAIGGIVVKANRTLPGGMDLAAASLSVTRNSIIMDRPHMTGFDGDEREYSLMAERAIQPLTARGQVRLETIEAKVSPAGQAPTSITAEAGDYDHEKSTLQLLGAIAVHSADGYRLRMNGASVDFGAESMTSGSPVSIGYGNSVISGERMSVSEGGKVIVIEGRVRTVLMPPKHKPAPQRPQAAAH